MTHSIFTKPRSSVVEPSRRNGKSRSNSRKRIITPSFGLFLLSAILPTACATHQPTQPPATQEANENGRSAALSPIHQGTEAKFVLQITIDQLRGDFFDRYHRHIAEGGFKRLIESGVWYRNAHHIHANTETVVGHSTLATGADPAVHGLIGNLWYDRSIKRSVYNFEDDEFLPRGYQMPEVPEALASESAKTSQSVKSQSQKAKLNSNQRTEGRSPRALQVPSMSDELSLHFNHQSKVFAVSLKDRGSIPLSGHFGKAFWFSSERGQFESSSYYYPDELPEWYQSFEKPNPAQIYSGKNWELSKKPSEYLFGENDAAPWESNQAGWGIAFPHQFGEPINSDYYKRLTMSPYADELTEQFVEALIEGESLGADDIPDYLSVSFSATDYIGHAFGPSSLEAEDNFLKLDRTIAKLLSFVDKKIGLDNTLIVLSADHGAGEAVGYLKTEHTGMGGFYPSRSVVEDAIKEELKRDGRDDSSLFLAYVEPYVYLDRNEIERRRLDLATVQDRVAIACRKIDGVSLTITSEEIREGALRDGVLERAVLANQHHSRAGDIYVGFGAYWVPTEVMGRRVGASHGSAWRYDSHVPILFSKPGLSPRRIHRLVDTKIVAPTLALWLGLRVPAAAESNPATEVLDR